MVRSAAAPRVSNQRPPMRLVKARCLKFKSEIGVHPARHRQVPQNVCSTR
jgi:hypothetical protein